MRWFNSKPKKKVPIKKRYELWKLRAKRIVHQKVEEDGVRGAIIKFLIAPIITIIAIFIIFLILDYNTFITVGKYMVVYYFPPLGKEWAIPLAIAEGAHPLEIALPIAFLDIITGVFLLWNYDFAKLIPWMGKWMEKAEEKNKNKLEAHPWWENVAFIGVALFVVFPFQGSGGVGASILGRVIGMEKHKVVVAIATGAIPGCIFLAYVGEAVIRVLQDEILWGLILLIIIAVILAIYNIYIRLPKKV